MVVEITDMAEVVPCPHGDQCGRLEDFGIELGYDRRYVCRRTVTDRLAEDAAMRERVGGAADDIGNWPGGERAYHRIRRALHGTGDGQVSDA